MTDEDRTLLEQAARAAGMWPSAFMLGDDMAPIWSERGFCLAYVVGWWNPLTDDGDAFRLAVALGLSVEPYPYYQQSKHAVIVKQRRRGDQMRETNPTEVVEQYKEDPCAATRRAIVRAAAQMGVDHG